MIGRFLADGCQAVDDRRQPVGITRRFPVGKRGERAMNQLFEPAVFREQPLDISVFARAGSHGLALLIGGSQFYVSVGSGPGCFTVRTGHLALRTIASATLPISRRLRPLRPCVPITIKSTPS